MSTAKRPYMPLYVKDLLMDNKVERLSTAEFGAYMLLLCRAWLEEPAGSIPDDDHLLARWTRQNLESWLAMKPAVLDPFTQGTDGRLYQKRMVKEHQKIRELSNLRRSAANRRWRGQKRDKEANQASPPDESDSGTLAHDLQTKSNARVDAEDDSKAVHPYEYESLLNTLPKRDNISLGKKDNFNLNSPPGERGGVGGKGVADADGNSKSVQKHSLDLDPLSPEALAQQWCFVTLRKKFGQSADTPASVVGQFSEWIDKLGVKPEAIRAELDDPKRDRSEYLWQLKKRLIDDARGGDRKTASAHGGKSRAPDRENRGRDEAARGDDEVVEIKKVTRYTGGGSGAAKEV